MAVPSRKRLIGVLGGMGPAATVDFLAKVVALTPATTDQEHVPLLIHSVPQIPSRVDAIASGSDAPLAPMRAGIALLERAGAEAIVIPCNTAHYWYDRLATPCSVEIIHIADAVASDLRTEPVRRLGLMATRPTIATRLYQDRLGTEFTDLLAPDEPTQALIDRAIAAVKRHDRKAAREAAEAACAAMLAMGADRLLLACTELPVALAPSPVEDRCLDATASLARATIGASLAGAAHDRPARRRGRS